MKKQTEIMILNGSQHLFRRDPKCKNWLFPASALPWVTVYWDHSTKDIPLYPACEDIKEPEVIKMSLIFFFPHLQISHCSGSSSTQGPGGAESEAPAPSSSSIASAPTATGPLLSSPPTASVWSNPPRTIHHHHLHHPAHGRRCVVPLYSTTTPAIWSLEELSE